MSEKIEIDRGHDKPVYTKESYAKWLAERRKQEAKGKNDKRSS